MSAMQVIRENPLDDPVLKKALDSDLQSSR